MDPWAALLIIVIVTASADKSQNGLIWDASFPLGRAALRPSLLSTHRCHSPAGPIHLQPLNFFFLLF
jgi:hypothetical protein